MCWLSQPKALEACLQLNTRWVPESQQSRLTCLLSGAAKRPAAAAKPQCLMCTSPWRQLLFTNLTRKWFTMNLGLICHIYSTRV